jgi:hypothetical protein
MQHTLEKQNIHTTFWMVNTVVKQWLRDIDTDNTKSSLKWSNEDRVG